MYIYDSVLLATISLDLVSNTFFHYTGSWRCGKETEIAGRATRKTNQGSGGENGDIVSIKCAKKINRREVHIHHCHETIYWALTFLSFKWLF